METSDQTIRRVLQDYKIGQKLRRIRLAKKLSLNDLGARIGVSGSMLSQLENGNLIPTLTTLVRIAEYFQVSLDLFFAPEDNHRIFSIVRSEERIRFADFPEAERPAYYFEELAYSTSGKDLCPYVAEFPKREMHEVQQHAHPGNEFVYMLEGVLGIGYGLRGDREEYILKAGDSARFLSTEPHCYYGQSDTPAKALVVVLPGQL